MTPGTALWLPEPGDVVLFPGAPFEYNRTLPYTVVSVDGDHVTFKPDGRLLTYTYTAAELHATGMTLAAEKETVR